VVVTVSESAVPTTSHETEELRITRRKSSAGAVAACVPGCNGTREEACTFMFGFGATQWKLGGSLLRP